MTRKSTMDRRSFLRQCGIGGLGLIASTQLARDLFLGEPGRRLKVGFAGDAPGTLWPFSRPAQFWEKKGELVQCRLCPHACLLGESDRGFCRTRVVKDGKLHTLVYGNPCTVHIDPVEKKPLFHFLPGSPILSLATAGCNLRCLNCQNWEMSQARPHETTNYDLMPEELVQQCATRGIPAIAYTYAEPIVFYEYVLDCAAAAAAQHIRNVLVTAGYIAREPLRKLCRHVHAANVDIKAFNETAYHKLTSANLAPVLDGLAILREEGVWIEITRLIVPAYSDDMADIVAMCRYIARELGEDTPVHFSRFHAAYKLQNLIPTPLELLVEARKRAQDAGLRYVYIGNAPALTEGSDTRCPACHQLVIERVGFSVVANRLNAGHCACGAAIAGVWA